MPARREKSFEKSLICLGQAEILVTRYQGIYLFKGILITFLLLTVILMKNNPGQINPRGAGVSSQPALAGGGGGGEYRPLVLLPKHEAEREA